MGIMINLKKSIPVLLIFLIGAAAGGLAVHAHYRIKIEHIIKGGPQAASEIIIRRLSEKLNLDENQKRQMSEIIRDSHEQMMEVREDVVDEIEEILDDTDGRVRAILRPEQRKKFDGIVEKRKKKKEEGTPQNSLPGDKRVL